MFKADRTVGLIADTVLILAQVVHSDRRFHLTQIFGFLVFIYLCLGVTYMHEPI